MMKTNYLWQHTLNSSFFYSNDTLEDKGKSFLEYLNFISITTMLTSIINAATYYSKIMYWPLDCHIKTQKKVLAYNHKEQGLTVWAGASRVAELSKALIMTPKAVGSNPLVARIQMRWSFFL